MRDHDPYTLTLSPARGRRLCKTRHADGTAQDYAAAKLLDLDAARVPDLPVLAALLRELLAQQDTCALRGAILDPARTRAVRRLLHRCPDTGDMPTFGLASRLAGVGLRRVAPAGGRRSSRPRGLRRNGTAGDAASLPSRRLRRHRDGGAQ